MLPSRRHVAAGAVALGVACGWLVLSPESALGRLRAVTASPWFPALLLALYLVRPFLAWPITLLSVLVGFQYGLAGLPLALVGAVATSLLPFAAARSLGTRTGLLGRLTDGSRRYFGLVGDLRGVVVARLAPTPAEPVSAAAGAAGVSAPAFVLGTLIGEFPWTVAAVVAGASMERLALERAAVDPLFLVAGAVAAGVLLAGPVYRYVREGAAGA